MSARKRPRVREMDPRFVAPAAYLLAAAAVAPEIACALGRFVRTAVGRLPVGH